MRQILGIYQHRAKTTASLVAQSFFDEKPLSIELIHH